MYESIWLISRDPQPMIEHVRVVHAAARTKVGRRKLRLFCAACLRLLWEMFDDPSRRLVVLLERVADGLASEQELERQRQEVAHLWRLPPYPSNPFPRNAVLIPGSTRSIAENAVRTALHVTWARGFAARRAKVSDDEFTPESDAAALTAQTETNRLAADLMREIFGNPFRPLPKRKFPADLLGLAQSASDDPAHYPLLADALADLGEDEAAAHCRLPNHVRGCHVVDWVLGKG
jgi:hypothetical protein